MVDVAHLLDGRAVDLLDLAHEQVDAIVVAQQHRELVDRDVLAALEHVDADDVAADRADARRDQTERTRAVGEPHPHEDVGGRLGGIAHGTDATGADDANVSPEVKTRRARRLPPMTARRARRVRGHVRSRARRSRGGRRASTRAQLGLDRVLLVVAGDPWQKRGGSWRRRPTGSRWSTTAVDGVDGVEASAIEIERDAPSVTADTLEALAAPGRELFLVLGADAVANMATWRRLDETRDLATIVVVERAGDAHSEPPGAGWRVRAGGHPAPRHLVDRPARAPRASGRPIDGLVPPAVVRAIRAAGLYTGGR